MAKQRWAPETSRFTNALDELQNAYLDILHDETEQALAGHDAVLERMRKIEKSAGTTIARINKKMKTEYSPVAKESESLSQTLAETQVNMAETMLTLQRIDQLLPAQDRLFAPGQPHSRHYPQLHNIAASSAASVPDLVDKSGQPSQPNARLDRTSANAALVKAHES